VRRLDSAAVSDQGQVRKRNEDALLAGEAVFAVADGMGGHLAGDVAAETALEPISALDGKVYQDASNAQAALLDAVLAANMAVVRRAASDPGLRGMGTTLTASLVEGRRLHVGHVGDSRAYLFRDGRMTQLTRDHTLVAKLIEEGRIQPEEAATHPHRSIITRAIGVDVDLDVDTLTIELHDGDRVLLCSDGLTGPVSDEEIEDVVTEADDLDAAAAHLVEMANDAGGPDNITVVLLEYSSDEPEEERSPEAQTASIDPVEAAAGPDTQPEDAAAGTDVEPGASPAGRPRRRRRVIIAGAAAAIVLLVAAAALGWWLLARSFFIGLDEEDVVIFRGIPGSVAGLDLHRTEEETDLTLEEVAPWYRDRLRDGVPADDLRDARLIVENAIPRVEDEDEEDDEAATDTEEAPAEPDGADEDAPAEALATDGSSAR
jgi:PPM family protein phosphatase